MHAYDGGGGGGIQRLQANTRVIHTLVDVVQVRCEVSQTHNTHTSEL